MSDTLLPVPPSPRRIVTSHDSEGKAIVSIDETTPSSVSILFSVLHNVQENVIIVINSGDGRLGWTSIWYILGLY